MFIQPERCAREQSELALKVISLSRTSGKEQRQERLSNMRKSLSCAPLDYRLPIESFSCSVSACENYYSLLNTVFAIADDPQWRNRIRHLCLLIKKLHNGCYSKNGGYLCEINNLPSFRERLHNTLYLADGEVQRHLKLLLEIYLANNRQYRVLDQEALSPHLLNAGRRNNTLEEYLWLLAQIKISHQCVLKTVRTLLDVPSPNLLLPTLTIVANYIAAEQNPNKVMEFTQSAGLRTVLLWGLRGELKQVQREALLACNNILSSGTNPGLKGDREVMEACGKCSNQESPLFLELITQSL